MTYGWQRLIAHEGRIRLHLTLRADPWVRHLQSGYRPNWRPAGNSPPDPMEGPLILDGITRIAPGESAQATVFPLLPQYWHGLSRGDHLEMLDLRGRVIGDGHVVAIENLPNAVELPPHGTH